MSNQETPEAQYNLAMKYALGQGVPQDYEEAARMFRAAATQGMAAAQYNFAQMYASGQGVSQDDEEAARWYRAAAEQENEFAQYNLAVMYANGEGVPQDLVQAHMWYNLAASQLTGEDRENAVKNRDRVSKKMTSEQLAEARRLAREWKPKSLGSQ